MVNIVAVILGYKNQVLIGKRLDKGDCAGLWEFPGGKIEAGETLEVALKRECKEEIGVEIDVKNLFLDTMYSYPDKTVHLFFMNAKITHGDIQKRVHSQLKWVDISALSDYTFCPANEQVINKLLEKSIF